MVRGDESLLTTKTCCCKQMHMNHPTPLYTHADPPFFQALATRVASLPTIVAAKTTAHPSPSPTTPPPPLALLPALLPALLLHHVEGVLLAKERLQHPVIPQPVASEGPAGGGVRGTGSPLLLPAPASSMQVVPVGAGAQRWAAVHSSGLQQPPHSSAGGSPPLAAPPAEACIADDGLLLGLAFLLHVLHVPASRFDTAAWFASVQEHYAAQRASMVEAARPGAAQHVGAHHAALAIARVERYAEEFVHTGRVLHTARVLVEVNCAVPGEE